MNNTEKTPHTCNRCGSSEINKTKVAGEISWLCKCGEHWRAHCQEWDNPPKYVRGRRVYKKDAKSRGVDLRDPDKRGRKMKP